MSEAQLAARLTRFVASVEAVWDAYRDAGAGRVEAALYEPVAAAGEALESTLGAATESDPILESVRVAKDLARRCACTSLGLSFISGEAGLIPRRDQHEALERALRTLRERAKELGGAGSG